MDWVVVAEESKTDIETPRGCRHAAFVRLAFVMRRARFSAPATPYLASEMAAFLTEAPPAPCPAQEAYALLARGRAAAKRMLAIAPEDPTSHYAVVKVHQTVGELPEALAGLQRCMALSEAQGNQYNIAICASTVGFCAVQVTWVLTCGCGVAGWAMSSGATRSGALFGQCIAHRPGAAGIAGSSNRL